MLKSGLVSISFRQLPPEQIITLAAKAGLSGIEWGGDVHVPPGDIARAKCIGEQTRANGLAVSAYGSYYRLGQRGRDAARAFAPVLAAAGALGAPVIRLWAGTKGSEEADEAYRAGITAEAKTLAAMAAAENMTLAFECHPDTLTDRCASTLRLMREIADEHLQMYWQPNDSLPFEENLRTLERLLEHLVNIHVFQWPRPGVREPLSAGEKEWLQYLSLAAASGKDHWCSLEFMPDDDPASLPAEAQTLLDLLNTVQNRNKYK